jgi:LacI family transcriptional regulator
MALGALSTLRELGLSVPNDIALAGFDDIITLRDVTPGLTTVRVPLEEVGRRAIEQALADETVSRNTTIPVEVVLRESTPQR